jgi:hypothetical protein
MLIREFYVHEEERGGGGIYENKAYNDLSRDGRVYPITRC